MSVQLEFVGHACFRLWENGVPSSSPIRSATNSWVCPIRERASNSRQTVLVT